MILSDISIRAALESGHITIDPLGDNAIQPSSVDLRVSDTFRVFNNHKYPLIDTKQPLDGLTQTVTVTQEDPFILHPGEFVLGSTLERVSLPTDLVARIEGKSSLGRLGLLVHATAGFIDAGFSGWLTLELSNVANLPIAIYPEMKISQLAFFRLDQPASRGYGDPALGSKYQGQEGPTPSQFHKNFSS
ncbi:dCTP deaminase [Stomatohabitans albus]|uniref:dCTP deaminase n=1 Tax=Stomatohabitans albus TaxID=3110766 RepID=UPI00300D01E3